MRGKIQSNTVIVCFVDEITSMHFFHKRVELNFVIKVEFIFLRHAVGCAFPN